MGMTDAELIAAATPEPNTTEGETTTEGTTEGEETAPVEVTTLDQYLENRENEADTTGSTETTSTTQTESSTGQSEETTDGEGDTDGPQTFTVKYDGEEHDIALDELLKGYGTNQSAQKKFNDAAHARKQAEEFIHQLKTDPWNVLSNPELGLNPRELAESYLAQQLQYEQLTPEQQELMQAKQQLHQFEELRQQQERDAHQTQLDDLTKQYHEEYTGRINTALETANLPNTEASIRRLAGYMSESLNSDDAAIQGLTDADLCELVREDYENDFKMMFSETDAETLQKILGDDVSKTLRQADIKKIVGKAPTVTRKPVKGHKNVAKKEAKQVSMDDYHSYLDSL